MPSQHMHRFDRIPERCIKRRDRMCSRLVTGHCLLVRIHSVTSVVSVLRGWQPSIATCRQLHACMNCLHDDLLAQIFKELSLHET